MTKKIYTEIMTQAVASAKKLVLQLSVYPPNKARLDKQLQETIADIKKDMEEYDSRINEETGEVITSDLNDEKE